MTPRHSTDVITRALWISATWLALAATAVLVAGCGGSSSSADSASAQVTKAQALAYANAINLRAADVPGLEESGRSTKREMAAGPFGRQLDRCEGTAARDDVVIGISSPRFVDISSRPLQSVRSGVYFFKNEALAHRYLAGADNARFAACVKTVFFNEPKTITREGSKVAQPMFSDPHISTLPASLPGVRTYGLRLAVHAAFGGPDGSESYEDFLSFVRGDTVITLNATSEAHPFPAATEQHLLSLLYTRAEAHSV